MAICNSIRVDASYARNMSGIACVALNKNNQPIDTFTRKEYTENSVKGEMYAVLSGVEFALHQKEKHNQLEDIIVYTDNQAVARIVNHEISYDLSDESKLKLLWAIWDILDSNPNIKVVWSNREENYEADALASYALRRDISGITRKSQFIQCF